MLVAAATAAIVDPERALSVPGRRLISIPNVLRYNDPDLELQQNGPGLCVGDVISFGDAPMQFVVTRVYDTGRVYYDLKIVAGSCPPPRRLGYGRSEAGGYWG
jgi:hypothetical protein